MSWVRNSAAKRALIAAALLATTSAALADILVIRSIGPSAKSFKPGTRLKEGSRIVLKANDSLDVLDGRGTRTLRGPGNFVAGAASQARAGAAPQVTQRRARIGAVRTAGAGELRPPSIWHVDVGRSSSICVAEPGNVTLWRSDSASPMTLNVTRAQGGGSARLDWPAGASTIGWPPSLPVSDGAEYRLSWTGAAAPTTITFRALPTRPVGLEDMASFLVANQCAAQLDLFIETVRLPDEAPPAG